MSDVPERLNAALQGRYRVERQLGEGGMATVYLADDLKLLQYSSLTPATAELAQSSFFNPLSRPGSSGCLGFRGRRWLWV